MSEAGEVEIVQEVDVLPVLAPGPVGRGVVADERQGRGALVRSVAPATQAVAVAAGGFLAGAAVVGLVGRRRGKGARAVTKGRRSARKGDGRGLGGGELVQILGTRSLLVDVHLLGGADR